MEIQGKKSDHSPIIKWLLWVVLAVLFLIMIFFAYYLVRASSAASRWVNNINQEFTENEAQAIDPELMHDETYILLNKQISFTKARLKMAATDSIGLTINLSDSTLLLEISGVAVSRVKASKMLISKSFRGIEPNALVGLFSNPLQIQSTRSTIVKEPIIEKIAPRDTLEANLPDKTHETAMNEPVYFELVLEKGIRIMVLQEEVADYRKSARFFFFLKRSVAIAGQNLRKLIHFELPEYHPQIQLDIPASDARAIYRALPEKGRLAIYPRN
jgi:hypothetical protein